MNIWIDLGHIPQYNFYRNLIVRLSQEQHTVYVTAINRGKLAKIVQKELGSLVNVKIFIIGEHKLSKLSAILHANLFRMIKLLWWKCGRHFDVAVSNCVFTAFIGWLYRIPNYAFDDDPQVWDYKPKIWFSTKSHYCLYKLPDNYKLSPKVKVLKALKEWSYLAPSVYKADISALDEYDVKPKEYVFLREVSVGTVNYTGQASGAILNVAHLIPKDKKVLFSLEDKSKRDLYPKDWILLQEPLKDVHSLIYYAAGLASSGDSMAREAALLGIPAYYLGIRHSMPANLAAAEVADFNNEVSLPFAQWVDQKLNKTPSELSSIQSQVRSQIDEKFDDINEYMYGVVKNEDK